MPNEELDIDSVLNEFETAYESMQFNAHVVDCNDGKHEDVKLEYDGEEYGLEIQDGKPVVVANE